MSREHDHPYSEKSPLNLTNINPENISLRNRLILVSLDCFTFVVARPLLYGFYYAGEAWDKFFRKTN